MVSSRFGASTRLLVTPALVVGLVLSAGASSGADRPVRQLFVDAKTKTPLLNRSFSTHRVQAPSDLNVYLFASNIELAFDKREFRPDAMIIPTNDQLLFEEVYPTTQKLLVDRLKREPENYTRVVSEADEYMKKQSRLIMATDFFPIQLKPNSAPKSMEAQPFPSFVCLIATDATIGGSIDLRPLFTQFKIKDGIEKCLAWLDAKKVNSVVMPLIGAASGLREDGHLNEESERKLMECRHYNSIAGIGLGIAAVSPKLKHIQEIGVIQWTEAFETMFPLLGLASHTQPIPTVLPDAGLNAYKEFAALAVRTLEEALKGTAANPPPPKSAEEPDCNRIYGLRSD